MNVSPIDIPTPGPTAASMFQRDGDRFARHIDAAVAEAGGTGGTGGAENDQERAKTLRKASEQLVATTFIMPMLAKMRDDPFKSDLFHGGQTEEFFGQRLDTIMAERIVAKTDFSIVDAVYNSIAKRASMLAGEAQGPADEAKGVDTHG